MSESTNTAVVVAGHICLDIIPKFNAPPDKSGTFLVPGTLVKMGPALLATGGAVSNTGQALHRLGVKTRLMGKVGDDLFGNAILNLVRGVDPELAAGMIVAKGETSSYTVVLNPPGVDRMFLHCTGTNDTFGAADVDDKKLAGAKLFHFGYPPLMRRMYSGGGRELQTLFRRVKKHGLITSLDMSMPDPRSEAGKADWPAILKRVLPHVDIFLPSVDEIQMMLKRKATLSQLAEQLRDLGAETVGLKLGDQGIYVRTANRELLAPCFSVKVAGTTGSGDCTIAGFLAARVRELPIEQALTCAVGVGACCCEAPDATSGVPSWSSVQRRIARGWKRLPVTLSLPGWRWDKKQQLWIGPNDKA